MTLGCFHLGQDGECVLGINLVQSMLGHLLHHFKWTLPDGLKAEDIDMSRDSWCCYLHAQTIACRRRAQISTTFIQTPCRGYVIKFQVLDASVLRTSQSRPMTASQKDMSEEYTQDVLLFYHILINGESLLLEKYKKDAFSLLNFSNVSAFLYVSEHINASQVTTSFLDMFFLSKQNQTPIQSVTLFLLL